MREISEPLPMPGAYFDLILRQFGATAAATTALLAGTGVSGARLADSGGSITLGQQLRQVRNANRSCPAGWALTVGAAFHPSTHGPLGVAAMSAPTLHVALRALERFLFLRNPVYRGRLRRQTAELRLEVEICVTLLDEERLPFIETFLLSFQGIIEAVLGRRMAEGRFEIAAPPPAYAARYRDYFHAPVEFERPVCAVVVPTAWATLRSPFDDPAMYAAAESALTLAARQFDRPDYTASRVAHLIQLQGDRGLPLAGAARVLRISPRTLVRQLQRAGTSFRELRDAHRHERAEELLREGTLSAAEVAYRLGYEDAANFGRACRRWFGQAPGAFARDAASDIRRALDAGGRFGKRGF